MLPWTHEVEMGGSRTEMSGEGAPQPSGATELRSDDDCLAFLWHGLYAHEGDAAVCPACAVVRPFSRVRRRRAYACATCGHHIYPAARTFIARSSLPLTTWFQAVAIVAAGGPTTTREFSERLGVSYRTALRMRRRIEEAQRSEGPDARLLALLVGSSVVAAGVGEARDAAGSRREGRRRTAAETREAIKEAACHTLAENGLAGTRVADIARAAGVSSAAVHYHFRRKEDVLLAGLMWAREQQRPAMARVMQTDDHMERLRRLVAAAVASGPVRDEYALWLEFMAGAAREPALIAEAESSIEWGELVQTVIEEGVRAGVFRPRVSAEDVASRFTCHADGLAYRVVSGSFGITAERSTEQLTSMLSESLDLPLEELRRPAHDSAPREEGR